MPNIATPYNIPEPESIYAGSYSEFDFKLLDPIMNIPADLTQVPNIDFSMCLYGNYSEPLIRFSIKDNTNDMPRIIINKSDKSHMTVFIYSDDTVFFKDNYYDFQISFLSYAKQDSTVIGQGKVRIFSKIG